VMLGLSQPDPRAFTSKQPDSQKQAMLLTVAVPKGGGQLDNSLCCSDDPMRPTMDRIYKYDREQHMTVTLQPRTGAYYVIPTLDGEKVTKKDYVLSLYCGKSFFQQKSIRVEFVALGPKSAALGEYVEFTEKEALFKPTQAQCQVLCSGNLQQYPNCGEIPVPDDTPAAGTDPVPPPPPPSTGPAPVAAAPQPVQEKDEPCNEEAVEEEGEGEEGECEAEEEAEEGEGEANEEEVEVEEVEEEEEVPKGKRKKAKR
jgi:hypothetical protein